MKKEMKKSPFFAKLLEKQARNTQNSKGGDNEKKTSWAEDFVLETLKYPSDNDEEVFWP